MAPSLKGRSRPGRVKLGRDIQTPPFRTSGKPSPPLSSPALLLLCLTTAVFFLHEVSLGVYSMKISNGNTSNPAFLECIPGVSPHMPTMHMIKRNYGASEHRNHCFSLLSTLDASSVKLKTILHQITLLLKQTLPGHSNNLQNKSQTPTHIQKHTKSGKTPRF